MDSQTEGQRTEERDKKGKGEKGARQKDREWKRGMWMWTEVWQRKNRNGDPKRGKAFCSVR